MRHAERPRRTRDRRSGRRRARSTGARRSARTRVAPSPAVRPSTASSPAPVRTVVVSGAARRERAGRAAVTSLGIRRGRATERTRSCAGESLWTIATDLLGRDATAAQVAREVHRLWQLNRDRIATGDPDLLPVGTTLVLR